MNLESPPLLILPPKGIAVNLGSELLNCNALQRVDLKSLPQQKGF
jgi:hypothetical protein